MPEPARPMIYHIVHVDRLPRIVADRCLWCDGEIAERHPDLPTIGMQDIKARRLRELTLPSHPGLFVGHCVPFYFCPRSVMLYLLHRGNHVNLRYRGGQGPILHLEADIRTVVKWAESSNLRWAFTLQNAGSRYFEDRADLARLGDLNWDAIDAHDWQGCKEEKQAEFLLENHLPWELVSRVGVHSTTMRDRVKEVIVDSDHKPRVEVRREWRLTR